jgi:hypothetical protein
MHFLFIIGGLDLLLGYADDEEEKDRLKVRIRERVDQRAKAQAAAISVSLAAKVSFLSSTIISPCFSIDSYYFACIVCICM